MRKLTVALLLAWLPLAASAQDVQPTGSGQDQPPADTLYQGKSKVELARTFITEVTRVTNLISTLPLDSAGGDVPANGYTAGKFSKVEQKADTYAGALLKNYEVIIPYADRKAIIDAIIYLRTIK